jgi:hypothetical protein
VARYVWPLARRNNFPALRRLGIGGSAHQLFCLCLSGGPVVPRSTLEVGRWTRWLGQYIGNTLFRHPPLPSPRALLCDPVPQLPLKTLSQSSSVPDFSNLKSRICTPPFSAFLELSTLNSFNHPSTTAPCHSGSESTVTFPFGFRPSDFGFRLPMHWVQVQYIGNRNGSEHR